MNISKPDELTELLDHVHDHWLDSENIVMRGQDLIVPLTSTAPSRVRHGITAFDLELVIHDVSEYDVSDPDAIRYYDLSEVIYRSESRQVILTSGFNFELHAKVEGFGISLFKRPPSEII